MATKRVVILGGGFGGLYAAKALKGEEVQITVIDRRNHHIFQPLLYQVATAGLNPSDIAVPIRKILRKQKNTDVLLGEVIKIDKEQKKVTLLDGEVFYDFLIVATGVTHSYFGHDEWAVHAPGLKTLEEALEIRRRIFTAFEAAERETDPERRAAWMTFVVIGGGPTGVELAGTLAEIARKSLPNDFRHIDPKQAKVILVESSDHILSAFPKDLSQSAMEQAQRLGVEMKLGSKVTNITAEGVFMGDQKIAARTVLWGAGVKASPVGEMLGVPLDRTGKVKVNPDLTIPGHKEIFVVGDLASLEQGGQLLAGVAQVAMQGGDHAADCISRSLRGVPHYEPFHYNDKGSMATIGRAHAIAMIGNTKLKGFIAWLAWLFVHILFLVGFRNRLMVLIQWAWAYFTYDRGARLITGQVMPLQHNRDDAPGT
jgi:NADH:ubiquinone reductase (H+-translocating)